MTAKECEDVGVVVGVGPKFYLLSDNRGLYRAPLAAISARPIRTLHFKFRPIRMSPKILRKFDVSKTPTYYCNIIIK